MACLGRHAQGARQAPHTPPGRRAVQGPPPLKAAKNSEGRLRTLALHDTSPARRPAIENKGLRVD